MGDNFAGGGAGGDLILVGARWGEADVGVASAAAAVEKKCGGQEKEKRPEDGADGAGGSGVSDLPEAEEGGGE